MQYDLFKKSKIWTMQKDSYLDYKNLNINLNLIEKKKRISNLEISPQNLLIVEYSNLYSPQLLEQEKEEDAKFMNMINEDNSAEMLTCMLPEQLRIFENCVEYNYPLKYFLNTINETQLLAFQKEASRAYSNSQYYDGNEDEEIQKEEEYSHEGEFYNGKSEIDSFLVDRDDPVDAKEYVNALVQGFQRIDNPKVFKHLNLGVNEAVFEGRDIDEIKEICIDFVKNLIPSEARTMYYSNPALADEEEYQNLLDKINPNINFSQEFDKNVDILFDDQDKRSLIGKGERALIAVPFKAILPKSNSNARLPPKNTLSDNGTLYFHHSLILNYR
jgi:hypothetical protein